MKLTGTNKPEQNSSKELFDALVADYTKERYDDINAARPKGDYTDEELESREVKFMEDAEQYARDTYRFNEEDLKAAMKLFRDYIFGYSIITDLINDDEVSDIRLLSYNNIRIKKKGVRSGCDVKFDNMGDYDAFIQYVATRNNVNISNLNAIQRFTDSTTNRDYILRFTLAMPLVNKNPWPILSIRKVPKDFYTLEQLINIGMLSKELADVLVERFTNGSTIICGGNSSGKTTMLNALKEKIPHNQAVLIAQQADELTTKEHPDMTFMHSLPGSGESEALYDLKNISIAGLTMDIDFFIIGEIKGDEAMYFLNAAYTGQYCAGTIHAPSAPKAINKVIDYAMVGSRYTKEELLKMMDCFNTVIFMKNFKVDQVYAINGYDANEKEMKYSPIFENGAFADDEWTGRTLSNYENTASSYVTANSDINQWQE